MEEKENNLLENEIIQVDDSQKGKVNKGISSDALKVIIDTHNSALLNAASSTYDPVNMAHALEGLSKEDLLFFFKSVKSDDSAEIFTYLDQDTKEEVVSAFSSVELHAIVDSMATDDLVDFVDDLPANLTNKVLKATSPEDRAKIGIYLNFKDDSAGTLMTPEYLSAKDDFTVKQTIDKIKKYGQDMETIWEIFIVDRTRRLVGTISLDKLLEAEPEEKISEIMTNDYVSVKVNTDQEIVLQAFKKYDKSVIPVTNSQDRMLGIITFDDVMDIQSQEDQEDAQLKAGVLPTDTPYLKTKIFHLVKSYGLWLIILLVLNTFTSMVLSRLQSMGTLLLTPVLISFLPSIMGTNGNASDQTATVTIRELALGNISTKNYFKAIRKELLASLITASILAIFSFGWMLVELYSGLISLDSKDMLVINNSFYNGNKNIFFLSISLLVALTFFITNIFSKLLGMTLPIVAKKIHLDPAVMSQPIISTILDIVSIAMYFLLSLLIIKVV